MTFNKKNTILLLSVISTICYIYARITLNRDVLIIAKPVAVLSVIIYYLFQTNRVNYIYLGALLACFVSDILFLFLGAKGLFIGLTLYFMASCIISIDIVGRVKIFDVSDFLKILLPTAIVMFSLFYFMFKDIGIIKMAVLLFSISLILLMSSALFYYSKTSEKDAVWILFGAFLFFMSNLIAGLNRFIDSKPIYGALASLFYISSLFCIVNYMFLEKKSAN